MMKQMRRRRWALMGALALLILMVGLALAGGEMMPRSLVSGGGGAATSEGLTLQMAVGQPAVGAVTSGGETLCGGFWCGSGAPEVTPEGITVYLPVILRP